MAPAARMTNINPALRVLMDPEESLAVAEALAVLEPDTLDPDEPMVVVAELPEPVAEGKVPEPVGSSPKSLNVPFLHSLRKSCRS